MRVEYLRALIVGKPPLSTTLLRVLVRLGLKTKQASSTAAAIRLIEQQRFDVIFAHLSLSKQEGIGFLKKAHAEGNDPVLIAISSHPHLRWVEQALTSGACDYLSKPISPENVRITLLRAWKRHESDRRAREATQKRSEQLVQFSQASDELIEEINGLKQQVSELEAQVATFQRATLRDPDPHLLHMEP